MSTWYGLFMPAGTSPAIVTKMNEQVNKLLAAPETQAAILAQGAEPQAMSVQDFDAMYKADFTNSKAVVEASGASIQ